MIKFTTSIDHLGGKLTEVHRLRTKRGLTQKDLATLAGISAATVGNMEKSPSERKGGVSIDAACNVARALGVEVDVLFPNTVLSYTRGRPIQTGTETRPVRIIKPKVFCPALGCNTEVSEHEVVTGFSECHGEALKPRAA